MSDVSERNIDSAGHELSSRVRGFSHPPRGPLTWVVLALFVMVSL